MKRVLLVVLLLAAVACGTDGKQTESYPATASQVRYVGRVLFEGANASFDWSGTYLEFDFTGGYCAMRVSDTKKNYYNIFIDSVHSGVVSTFGCDSLVVLANLPSKGRHTLRLQKRTEGEQGRTTIHGFELAPRGEITACKVVPTRHIEFIGNSLTCGFGTEGKSREEPFMPETQNCDYAFGCIIARYFDADYTLIAHSGRGVARNYGYSEPVSPITMREIMMRLFDEDDTVLWDFSASPYRPDLVVINLGSNDFSTFPHPSGEDFRGSYEQIIAHIRAAYGQVPILCVAPPLGEPAFTYIREVCNKMRQGGDGNIFFTAIMPGYCNIASDLGSSAHPNYTGQRKMAMTLIPFVSTITGWELSEKPAL